MGDPFTYRFVNIAPGETTATKRVDADRIMANFDTLVRNHAYKRAMGEDCVDGNATNGFSDAAHCNITVYTEEIAGEARVGGLLDQNDYVQITDGTSVWKLQSTLANDELSFDDTHLASGAGPADYSLAAFIDSLEIKIFKFCDVIGASQLILDETHADAVMGSVIPRSAVDGTMIETALADVETDFAVEHEGDGTHSDDILSVANIAENAMIYETVTNLVYGTMDYDEDDDGRPDGWTDYNTPTSIELSTTQVKEGTYSCKVVTSQPSDGIVNDASVNPIDPTLFQGRQLAFAAWVWCTSNNTVKLELYDGVDTTTSAAGGTAAGWVRLYVVHTVNAAATEITPRIYTTEATTIYVDAAMLCQGKLAAGFVPHVNEEIRARLAAASQVNWLLNPSFADWSSGVGGTDFPDFWTGTCEIQPVGGPGDGGFLENARCTFDLGEVLSQSLPVQIYDFMLERTIYFRADIKSWAANADELRMKIYDGVDTSYVDVVPGAVGTYITRGLKHTVNVAATELTVSFENQDANTISVDIRNCILTVDSAPIGFVPSVYKPYFLYFYYTGTLPTTAGYMTGQTSFAEEVIFPSRGIIQALHVKLGTAPGGILTSDFEVWYNGAAKTGYHCDIDGTDTEDADGIPAASATVIGGYDGTNNDTIGVKAVQAMTGSAANARAVVKLLVWE